MGGSMWDAFANKGEELKKKGLMDEHSGDRRERSQEGRPERKKGGGGPRQSQDKRKKPGQGRDEEGVKKVLPLYREIGNIKQSDNTFFIGKHRERFSTANPGLVFDKFCDIWSGPQKQWAPEAPKKGKAVKHDFLDEVVTHLKGNGDIDALLTQYHRRRELLLADCSGHAERFQTSWRFVSGLGMGHVLETGFVWHRVLGVPYLPGSSVKGLVRAWAEMSDKETATRLFGPKDEGPTRKPDTGDLIVFDAVPVTKPELEVDIMNPHYAPYYGDRDGKTPPADYHSPRPIFFLTVAPGAVFSFAFGLRRGCGGSKADVDTVFRFLSEALDTLGAGGKTAVGYGFMTRERDDGKAI